MKFIFLSVSTPYLSPTQAQGHPVVTAIQQVDLGEHAVHTVQFEPGETVYTEVKSSDTFKYEPDAGYTQVKIPSLRRYDTIGSQKGGRSKEVLSFARSRLVVTCLT